jgi:hypothetical protein
MRLWLIICLGVGTGTAAGAAMTWLELGRVVESFESASQSKATTTTASNASSNVASNAAAKATSNVVTPSHSGGPRAFVVGGNKFQFGSMAFGSTNVQTFVIRNEGDKPLTVEFVRPSCGKCIETTFTKTTVPPGETCDVAVTYHARKEGPAFEESAIVKTNDPRAPEMLLSVAGVITKPIRIEPQELTFGAIPSSEGATATTILLGFHSDSMTLSGHKFNSPSMAELFNVVATPLPMSKVLDKDAHATCGLELKVTAKPGLPLGPITETMVLALTAEKEHSLDLPITGEVVGDITVIGKNYFADRGVLGLGLLKQGEGRFATLFLLVKGPQRHDVKFSVGKIVPPNVLQVQIGEAAPLGDGKALRIPVTIEVPKSAPAQSHMGDARGDMAKITLETTHPTVKQIPISVRFVVE